MDDSELLSAYLEAGSEDAFASLVDRHVKMVYSAALRQVGGDAHLAKDVVQNVFTALARKAWALRDRKVLSGWLYTGTCFAAAEIIRGERRRRAREQAAQSLQEPVDGPAPDLWDRLRPVLDQAMNELGARDRQAILLRYFEDRSFADIGEKLELSEDSARKRVERALDKMHGLLSRRGVGSTAAALGAVLTGQAAAAAVPAGLSSEISGAALAGAVPAGAAGLIQLMATAKTNAWIFAGIVALSATAVFLERQSNDRLRSATQSLQQQDERTVAALATGRRAERRQAAALEILGRAEAATHLKTANPASDFDHSPAYQRVLLQLRPQLLLDYAALFRRLHLPPDQQGAIAKLLLEKRMTEFSVAALFSRSSESGLAPDDMGALKAMVSAGTGEIDDEIRQQLGPELFDQYRNYTATLSYRSEVDNLAAQLAHSPIPLRDDQADQLVALLANARTDVQPLPDALATQAAAILDPRQAPALRVFLGALQARQTVLAMNRAALAQDPPLIPAPAGSALLINLQP